MAPHIIKKNPCGGFQVKWVLVSVTNIFSGFQVAEFKNLIFWGFCIKMFVDCIGTWSQRMHMVLNFLILHVYVRQGAAESQTFKTWMKNCDFECDLQDCTCVEDFIAFAGSVQERKCGDNDFGV